jgi:hypothetical protein
MVTSDPRCVPDGDAIVDDLKAELAELCELAAHPTGA